MTSNRRPGLILLHTKLNRPGITRDLVVRPRLLKMLDDGLDRPLTLVVAPAGFGKTTLISSWLAALEAGNQAEGETIHTAWLSLDENDNDIEVFLHYFIAAVRMAYPEACSETLALLGARQAPSIELISNVLSNELEQLPGRLVMVLDDLHSSRNPAMFDVLSSWLRHWPPRLHLVLLSRINPPLPLTTLRARGQVMEIRVRDLRFTPDETATYFDNTLAKELDEDEVALINQRLEGWIAGLKLITLSVVENDSVALAPALQQGDVYAAEYLMDEVLHSLPVSMQEFLLHVSLVDQFCASLCAAIVHGETGEVDAEDYLEQIVKAELFVTPLDYRGEWYRLHRLFRDLLRQRLSVAATPEVISLLHLRAARWFADHALPDQAIYHAIEAGSYEAAAEFMHEGLRDVLNREDRPMLEHWLRLLPEEFIQRSPGLLVMRAFAHGFRWELDHMAAVIRKAEELLNQRPSAEQTPTLRGLIAVAKGQGYYHVNDNERVVAYCQAALSLLDDDWLYARGMAAVYLGVALQACGRGKDADRFLASSYESCRDKTDGYALRLLLAQTINALQTGAYESAERVAQTMLRQALEGQLLVMAGWGHYLLGFIYYEWNQLDEAMDHFSEVASHFHATNLACARNAFIGQALIHQALGREREALAVMDRLGALDLSYRGREDTATASARARLNLIQGNLDAADRWADRLTHVLGDDAFIPWMEQNQLTWVMVLISRQDGPDILEALRLLDEMLVTAEQTFKPRVTIQLLALNALAKLAAGDTMAAHDDLIRSLELARRGLYTRTYVDLGPQMRKLLLQVANHLPTAKTADRLLAAFPGEWQPAVIVPAGRTAAPFTPANGADGNQSESLTPRELEVLVLMREPIGIREIADRLNISYATARRYTINVYDKFDVHSRWEAVDAAIRKGIITPR